MKLLFITQYKVELPIDFQNPFVLKEFRKIALQDLIKSSTRFSQKNPGIISAWYEKKITFKGNETGVQGVILGVVDRPVTMLQLPKPATTWIKRDGGGVLNEEVWSIFKELNATDLVTFDPQTEYVGEILEWLQN
mgnify:CR=1 FL=1